MIDIRFVISGGTMQLHLNMESLQLTELHLHQSKSIHNQQVKLKQLHSNIAIGFVEVHELDPLP